MNFAITSNFVAEHGGVLALRIDDVDVLRIRSEYVEDIFDVISWLDIHPSETTHTRDVDAYQDALASLSTFVCRCSRSGNACECFDKGYDFTVNESAVKIRLDEDVVLWRRDDLPAYHLVNVVEDERMGITHVIRGEDLRQSSRIHEQLAQRLGYRPATYLHHALILDDQGAKLSKSTMRNGKPLARSRDQLAEVRELAASMVLT